MYYKIFLVEEVCGTATALASAVTISWPWRHCSYCYLQIILCYYVIQGQSCVTFVVDEETQFSQL